MRIKQILTALALSMFAITVTADDAKKSASTEELKAILVTNGNLPTATVQSPNGKKTNDAMLGGNKK